MLIHFKKRENLKIMVFLMRICGIGSSTEEEVMLIHFKRRKNQKTLVFLMRICGSGSSTEEEVGLNEKSL